MANRLESFTDTYAIAAGSDGRAVGYINGYRNGGFTRLDRVDYSLSITHTATLTARNDNEAPIEIVADAVPTVDAYFRDPSEHGITVRFEDFGLSLSLDPGETGTETLTTTLEGLLSIDGQAGDLFTYEILFEDLNRLLDGFTGTYASSFSGTLAVTYHYTRFPDVAVPAPAGLALVGLGVLGVAVSRRTNSSSRRQRNAGVR